jgi:dienelactone hydrolase
MTIMMTTTTTKAGLRYRRPANPYGTGYEVTFPSGERMLTGYLWVPPGSGPFRAVVFNHGSERYPATGAALARFFNWHDYVLFVPLRRGHGDSPGPYIGDLRNQASGLDKARVVVAELESQVDDVVASLAYLQTRPEVRRDAIAVTGTSFGGIEALLTAERETDFKCAVDFAGGAMMWDRSGPLRRRMIESASRATIPVLFLQAANDFNTAPTRVLAAEMARLDKLCASRIYPPSGTTMRDGHRLCRRNIGVWGRDVLAWFDRTMP